MSDRLEELKRLNDEAYNKWKVLREITVAAEAEYSKAQFDYALAKLAEEQGNE